MIQVGRHFVWVRRRLRMDCRRHPLIAQGRWSFIEDNLYAGMYISGKGRLTTQPQACHRHRSMATVVSVSMWWFADSRAGRRGGDVGGGDGASLAVPPIGLRCQIQSPDGPIWEKDFIPLFLLGRVGGQMEEWIWSSFGQRWASR